MNRNKDLLKFVSLTLVWIVAATFAVGCAKKKSRKVPVTGGKKTTSDKTTSAKNTKITQDKDKINKNKKAEAKTDTSGPPQVSVDGNATAATDETFTDAKSELVKLLEQKEDLFTDGSYQIADKVLHVIEDVTYDGDHITPKKSNIVSYTLELKSDITESKASNFKIVLSDDSTQIVDNYRVLNLPTDIVFEENTFKLEAQKNISLQVNEDKTIKILEDDGDLESINAYNLSQWISKIQKYPKNDKLFGVSNKKTTPLSITPLDGTDVKTKTAHIAAIVYRISEKAFRVHYEIKRKKADHQQIIEHFVIGFVKK